MKEAQYQVEFVLRLMIETHHLEVTGMIFHMRLSNKTKLIQIILTLNTEFDKKLINSMYFYLIIFIVSFS